MGKMKRLLYMMLAVSVLLSVLTAAAEVFQTAEELIIDPEELTEEPAFIDWIRDETPMQLIALKDAKGNVRLAFNTCQTCNGSPWAWFEYLENGKLECQNCGQQVSPETVGAEDAWGCVPIPITEFSVREDGTIAVPEQVLADAVQLFANWRKTGE